MKLYELIDGFWEKDGVPNLEIDNLTEDSRTATGKSLLICIVGAVADGHDYASRAYRNGCRVFVAQKPLSLPPDATVLLCDNTRKALASLACRFYGNPSHSMRLFGVTGTKGKTTVAHLIAGLSKACKIACGYIGTNGIDYADLHKEIKNTTPDALTLQKTLAEMLANGVQVAVLEVSSQALAQYRADGILFETLLYTNLAPDHIGAGEHADFEDYKACKKRLFTDFTAKNVVYWADDAYAQEMVGSANASRLIACSQRDENADCHLKDVLSVQRDGRFGIAFGLQSHGTCTDAYLSMVGDFNAQNATLAIAALEATFSIPAPQQVQALKHLCVPGRSEQYTLPLGGTVCIDYAHNAFSLQSLLRSVKAYAPKRLLVLFGSVGERTQLRRMEMGAIAADLADGVILTSDNPGHEAPEQIIEEIAAGFGAPVPCWKIPDRKEAILFALSQIREGDFLVLAGKGHEAYQLIGSEKRYFSEKAIITDYIAQQTKETVFQ